MLSRDNLGLGAVVILVLFVLPNLSQGPDMTGNVVEEPTVSKTSESEIELQNMSSVKKEEIGKIAKNFYKEMPRNKSERLEVTAEIANNVCSDLEKIDKDAFSAASDTKRQAYRIKHAAQIIEENFNREISPEKIERVISGAGEVGRFVTVVGPYNKFVEDSCQLEKGKPETVEDFYVSSASLGLELALVQYGIYYKGASEVTRMASHSRTFRMVQTKLGDDALGAVMSETHWAVRNTFQGANQFSSQFMRENGLEGEIKINETKARAKAIDKYDLATNKTQNALKDIDLEEKISCLKESANWRIADKVTDILSDMNVEENEVQNLPPAVQEDFTKCLS